MLYVINYSHEPHFNIAAEEYLLKNFTGNILMLWRNKPSVIVGKHQLTIAESNQKYIQTNNIPVVRRISGGGTVFHDTENINFTVIISSEKPAINFQYFTLPVIDFLKKKGLNACFEGKNNIRINGLKVSGNAAHIYKNKILYHGTLLFNSRLDVLKEALNPTGAKYVSKAVQSIRSEVANIKSFFERDISILEFENQLKEFLINHYSIKEDYLLSNSENEKIEELVSNKYSTQEWNYNYSPDFHVKNQLLYDNSTVNFCIKVKRGLVTDVEADTEDYKLNKFFSIIKGQGYSPENILSALNEAGIEKGTDISDISTWNILKYFF